MYIFKRCFVITCVLAIWAGVGLADEQAQELPQTGSVKLATGNGYAPFADDSLPEGGWSVDVIKQTFKQLDLSVELDIVPWERALRWTKDNQVLAAFPFVYSKARAQQFIYSDPINYVPIHLYVAQSSDYVSLKQLEGKRLCYPLDYSIGTIEQDIIDRFNFVVNRAKDGFACVKHVTKGWSDAGITNGHIDATRIKVADEKLPAIRVFDELLGNIPLYLVVGKHHPHAQNWIDEFNHGLKLLETSGKRSGIDKFHLQIMQKP